MKKLIKQTIKKAKIIQYKYENKITFACIFLYCLSFFFIYLFFCSSIINKN